MIWLGLNKLVRIPLVLRPLHILALGSIHVRLALLAIVIALILKAILVHLILRPFHIHLVRSSIVVGLILRRHIHLILRPIHIWRIHSRLVLKAVCASFHSIRCILILNRRLPLLVGSLSLSWRLVGRLTNVGR